MSSYLRGYGFPPLVTMPPHQPSNPDAFAALQWQTTANNAVSSHYESERRLTKNYKNFVDASTINGIRAYLSNMTILPLRKSLEITTPFPIELLPVRAQDFIKTGNCSTG
jgi:hypothetical protein